MADVGTGQRPPKPKNARKRRTVKLKKGFDVNPEFKALWERIAARTRYRVRLDTERLIDACADAVAQVSVEPVQIRIERGRVEGFDEIGQASDTLLGQGAQDTTYPYDVPNVTEKLAEATDLTRRTLRRIVQQAGNLDQVFDNPAEYLRQAAEVINREKRRFLVNGIEYLEMGDHYRMSLFEDLESYQDSLVPIEKSIYDHVIADSDVERDFALRLEQMDEVKLFVKLPGWFTVPTPIGTYNPDWAIVFVIRNAFGEEQEKLYLVRETKGALDPDARRGIETMKIDCANAHFALLDVDYRDIVSADDLP
jgi:type III restriction enzyme